MLLCRPLGQYNFVRHFVGSIGYKFNVNKDIHITPILQGRNVQGFNIQPDAIVKFDYKDFLWTAVHYNYKRSYAITLGVAVSEMFVIGYSAEFAANDFAGYSGGTHEIVFGIKFGKPFQTAINKTAIEKMQKTTRGYDERLEYMKRENERMRLELKEQNKILEDMMQEGVKVDYDKVKNLIDNYNDSLQNAKPKSIEVKEQEQIKKKLNKNAGSIQFKKGTSKLLPSSDRALNDIVKILNDNPKAKLIIKGYTDNVGSDASNIALSQKRADAVKAYILKKGIKEEQISSKGMGSANPVSDNKTEKGREQNRRVEIEIAF